MPIPVLVIGPFQPEIFYKNIYKRAPGLFLPKLKHNASLGMKIKIFWPLQQNSLVCIAIKNEKYVS